MAIRFTTRRLFFLTAAIAILAGVVAAIDRLAARNVKALYKDYFERK